MTPTSTYSFFRSSSPASVTALSDRMETAGVPLSPGFQAHHLIPDEVARTHPLAQAARARGVPPWDLDNPQNGIALPGSADKVGTTGLPVHRGSHKNYTRHAHTTLTLQHDMLVRQYGGLDKVPPEVLVKTMKELEKKLRQDIDEIPQLRSADGRLH